MNEPLKLWNELDAEKCQMYLNSVNALLISFHVNTCFVNLQVDVNFAAHTYLHRILCFLGPLILLLGFSDSVLN